MHQSAALIYVWFTIWTSELFKEFLGFNLRASSRKRAHYGLEPLRLTYHQIKVTWVLWKAVSVTSVFAVQCEKL